MTVVAMRNGSNQRCFIKPVGNKGKMFAYLIPGDFRSDGFKLTSDFLGRIGLHIKGINMARAAE